MLKKRKGLSHMWQRARELRRKATLEEVILWKQLKNKNLFQVAFRRQYVIGKYVADFYCHKAKLVIELDGSHHADPAVMKKDSDRTKFFKNKDIKEIRFWNDEIRNDLAHAVDYLLVVVEQRVNHFNKK